MINLNEDNILSNLDFSTKVILGKGYVSEAYKVKLLNNKENEYTVLKGLIKDSYKCYEDSFNNLKFIYNNGNPLIKSIKIPFENLILIKSNNEFKYGALIYKNITGIILKENLFNKINIENITNLISNFLTELYNIPIDKNFSLENYKKTQLDYFNTILLTLTNYLQNKNILYDNIKLLNLENEYKNYLKEFKEPHFIHGDFWEENMIISNDYQNLLGIIDFDNFGIGDNALDFATLSDFGYDFINIVLNKCNFIKDKEKFIIKVKMFEKWVYLDDFYYLFCNWKKEDMLLKEIEEMKKLNLI